VDVGGLALLRPLTFILAGMEWAAVCDQQRLGFLEQPGSAVTSAAFVVAAAGILAGRPSGSGTPAREQQSVFALLAAGIGVGSFVQHGPHPSWQAYAHDLPLAAALVFVAVDAASDLSGRELSPAWWLVPSAAMLPVVAAGPTASTTAQAAMAAAAIALNLLRALHRPALRAPVLMALGSATAGAVLSRLTGRSGRCGPESLILGHPLWHLLAAAALLRLAAAVGARQPSAGVRIGRRTRPGRRPARQEAGRRPA
jgi:hypothetical protein